MSDDNNRGVYEKAHGIRTLRPGRALTLDELRAVMAPPYDEVSRLIVALIDSHRALRDAIDNHRPPCERCRRELAAADALTRGGS